MKKAFSILFFGLLFLQVNAQETFQPKPLEPASKGVIYNSELAFDLRLHTNGFALGANFGKIRTYYKTRYFHVGIGELKHHKENRANLDRSNSSGRLSRSFVYGKQNNLFVTRIGYGEKRYFSEKAKRKGVAVGISYEGGFTAGLLKPYYLELLSTENSNPGPSSLQGTFTVKYSEENQDYFLNPWNIFGSSSWTRGLTETSIIPGIHTQFAVHVDWGAFDEYVKAIEAGIMVDAFIRQVPIMVELEGVENRPFFVNLFINLQIGKRK